MKIKKSHYIGAGVGLALVILSYAFMSAKNFPLFAGISVLIGALPFMMTVIREVRLESEKEEMFLEFARNLVESVKTGTPVSKSIINMRNKNYNVLTKHIKKLANQIEMGIPLNEALKIFAKDVDNRTISRSLTLIGQAEKAGGDIGIILEAVAGAVSMSDKLKKERKAAISTLVTQGYIIFLVFIIIILIMQFQIIPMVSGIGDVSGGLGDGLGFAIGGAGGDDITQSQVSNAFLYLILVQGFFTGLTIGKLSEGSIKAGAKHSFALVFISFLISTGANVLFG